LYHDSLSSRGLQIRSRRPLRITFRKCMLKLPIIFLLP
jgi:hypothetical protein